MGFKSNGKRREPGDPDASNEVTKERNNMIVVRDHHTE